MSGPIILMRPTTIVIPFASVAPYTKSLLHFNGADASTTFTDENGRIWTAHGNAQLDTAQKKFGTASLLLDGTGDYIDTPVSSDFNVGNSDWGISFFIKKNASIFQHIIGQADSTASTSSCSISMRLGADNVLQAYVFYGSSNKSIIAGTLDTNWNHVALMKYGNIMTLYLNGTSVGTADMTGVTINSSPAKFTIGRFGEYTGGQYFNGWIDELLFENGVARWTSNFTPPTTEHSA